MLYSFCQILYIYQLMTSYTNDINISKLKRKEYAEAEKILILPLSLSFLSFNRSLLRVNPRSPYIILVTHITIKKKNYKLFPFA